MAAITNGIQRNGASVIGIIISLMRVRCIWSRLSIIICAYGNRLYPEGTSSFLLTLSTTMSDTASVASV